ncbi:MAG TPA: hypothetical protein VIA45_17430 [Thermoanaerobaculia bacterium]
MRNPKTLIGLTAAAFCGSLLLASPAAAEGRIHKRADRQQERIGQGVQSGQLTAGETARLERKEAGLNKEIRGMRQENGGRLSKGDRALINHQQNQLSRQIYRQKHDGQTRH